MKGGKGFVQVHPVERKRERKTAQKRERERERERAGEREIARERERTPPESCSYRYSSRRLMDILPGFPIHTVEYDPFIKSQNISRN